MSKAPLIRAEAPEAPRPRRVLVLALLLACVAAAAGTQDRNQPISVSADHFETSREAGATTLSGRVSITQGTLQGEADLGTAHRDADGRTRRIVLEGQPARLQQRMDDGSLMQARARTIDYEVLGDTITLSGDAEVEQPGQGRFSGARLVYNPATGAISGSGGSDGRVHLTLEPRAADQP